MRLKYASRDLYQVGYVKKTHGHKGDIIVVLEDYPTEEFIERESVFIRIDGLPVPFFMQEVRIIDDHSMKLKLEDVDHLDLAKELSSRQVFLPAAEEKSTGQASWEQYTGYSLIDQDEAPSGVVTGFESYSGNNLFIVEMDGRQVLIPVDEQLIVEINPEVKTISMVIPGGLINGLED